MRVIVDTSVLMALDRIGHIDVLRRLFGSTDESTSSPALPVFLFSGFRQGRRPALKQGPIEGSDFPKPIGFAAETAIQSSLPGSQPDRTTCCPISTQVDSRS